VFDRDDASASNMKTTQVRTFCECQACLIAEFDEQLNVIAGYCEDSRARKIGAPASKAFVSVSQVGVSFSCPVNNYYFDTKDAESDPSYCPDALLFLLKQG